MPFYGQYENACPFPPCFPLFLWYLLGISNTVTHHRFDFIVTGLENVFLKHFYSLSFLLFTPWFHGANYGQPDRNFVVDFPNEKKLQIICKTTFVFKLNKLIKSRILYTVYMISWSWLDWYSIWNIIFDLI